MHLCDDCAPWFAGCRLHHRQLRLNPRGSSKAQAPTPVLRVPVPESWDPWFSPDRPEQEEHDLFKVMFYSPRIAPNTGNAIRMVAATGVELHLVEPLGFDLSEPKLKRAGLDYHDLASVTVHASLPAAWEAIRPERVYAYTAHATTSFSAIAYQPGDVLMFGPEPTGLDAETLADPHITTQLRIPMLAGRRSLNLSNAAAVAVYEAWRQHDFAGSV